MLRALFVIALVSGGVARAETWPTLEQYVGSCVLIVKARTIVERGKLTFRVIESWRGRFDPKRFASTTSDGRFFAEDGEHGVKVVDGQEIVFFFTRSDQTDAKKLSRHSTAFPVTDGSVVYASTGAQPQRFTVEAFKRAIALVK